MVDAERVILRELELLAPAGDVPAPDWKQVLQRLEPSQPALSRRRTRVAVVAAAAALVVVAAGAAYVASRAGSPGPVKNGELVIDSAPGEMAQLSAVAVDGRLRILWKCPHSVFCGDPAGMSWSPDGSRSRSDGGSRPPLTIRRRRRLTMRTGKLTHLSSGRDARAPTSASPTGSTGHRQDGRSRSRVDRRGSSWCPRPDRPIAS